MKEVHDVAMNVCAAVVEGKLVPQAEVVIIFTEPHYRVEGKEGRTKQERHVGAVRFMMGPKRMRQMAEGLMQAADVVEKDVAAAVLSAVDEAKLKAPKPETGTDLASPAP